MDQQSLCLGNSTVPGYLSNTDSIDRTGLKITFKFIHGYLLRDETSDGYSSFIPIQDYRCGKVYVDYRIKRHTPLPVW